MLRKRKMLVAKRWVQLDKKNDEAANPYTIVGNREGSNRLGMTKNYSCVVYHIPQSGSVKL